MALLFLLFPWTAVISGTSDEKQEPLLSSTYQGLHPFHPYTISLEREGHPSLETRLAD